MAANTNGVEFRDYIRVVFSRAWWFAYVTLAMVAAAAYASFFIAQKHYVARNEIKVTEKYFGSLPKEIADTSNWMTRMRKVEQDAKRSVPAREIVLAAASAVGESPAEADIAAMVDSLKDNLKLEYLKEAGFVRLTYEAGDARLAAAVLSIFIQRTVEALVTMQVQELDMDVMTLSALRAKLAADVAAAERKLDQMKTVAPELKLSATTMALLRGSKDITTMPSTEQAVAVFLELQRDIITLDGHIADICQQIESVGKQVRGEAETVTARKRLETLPSVREATKRRDGLTLELTELLANSTAQHPMVKKLQAELRSIDMFLSQATTESTVEVIYEANQKRREMQIQLASFDSQLAGLRKRRLSLEENAEKWREKLDTMPSELRTVREATLEYEKKADTLSMITDKLVQAQIRRSLELEKVATYYQPQWDPTPVPDTYRSPRHSVFILLGLALGMIASVFVIYALEFADHSVKDQRDLRFYSKAAVLGVISDYNELKAVARRTPTARAAVVKRYLLAIAFVGLTAFVAWGIWTNWPAARKAPGLPPSLGLSAASNVQEAMRMYGASAADLQEYAGAPEQGVDVVPAIQVSGEPSPQPALSE